MKLLFLIGVGLAFLFCHWQCFRFTSCFLQNGAYSRRRTLASYLMSYGFFILMSLMQMHLLFNWLGFLLLMLLGLLWVFRCKLRVALFMALMCLLVGLSANNAARCLLAILLNQPLAAFNNEVSYMGNLKEYPVFLGFLMAGFGFVYLRRRRYYLRLRLLLQCPPHLRFLTSVTGLLFCYLFLNLFLYNGGQNNLVLKLWGLKSSGFVWVSFGLAVWYARRMCQLSLFRNQNQQMRQKVAAKRELERSLRSLAYHDALTGLYNRHYAVDRIAAMLDQQRDFCLSFVDLDGLKAVNDQWGHSAGDTYLVTVAREMSRVCRKGWDSMFRFGGDEFLLLFMEPDVEIVEARMRAINEHLQSYCTAQRTPFAMAVSFGVVRSQTGESTHSLLQKADAKMYAHKQRRLHR